MAVLLLFTENYRPKEVKNIYQDHFKVMNKADLLHVNVETANDRAEGLNCFFFSNSTMVYGISIHIKFWYNLYIK